MRAAGAKLVKMAAQRHVGGENFLPRGPPVGAVVRAMLALVSMRAEFGSLGVVLVEHLEVEAKRRGAQELRKEEA